MNNQEPETAGRVPFPPARAALIALAITGFILVFRPFGISIGSFSMFLIVAGLAPLNFAMMLGVHQAPLPRERIRAVICVGAISLANIGYLAMWNAGADLFGIGFKVILVAILAVAAIALWNRQRTLHSEIVNLKRLRGTHDAPPIVLSSEDGKEILRLERSNLLYATARGNYVEVHYLKASEATSSLLRSTLSAILEQAPEGVLRRCHRSHIVNLDVAQRVVKDARHMQIEFDGSGGVPVSRKFRPAIMDAAPRN